MVLASSVSVVPFLLLVAGLIVAAAVLVRLRQVVQGPSGKPLQTITLPGGGAVHVVDVEGKRLLVASAPTGVPRLLCELSGKSPPPLLAVPAEDAA